jgi:hypothetical protein
MSEIEGRCLHLLQEMREYLSEEKGRSDIETSWFEQINDILRQKDSKGIFDGDNVSFSLGEGENFVQVYVCDENGELVLEQLKAACRLTAYLASINEDINDPKISYLAVLAYRIMTSTAEDIAEILEETDLDEYNEAIAQDGYDIPGRRR